MTKEEKKGSLGKGGVIAIVVCAVVIICLLAVIVGLLLKDKGGDTGKRPVVEARPNMVANSSNAEDVATQLIDEPYVEPGYYKVLMNTTWHFAKGDAASDDAYVENDTGNTNDVYFDLYIEGDEENPILESPVIPRGAKMENFALDKPLAAGTYDCIMVYHLVDEEQNPVSSLRVGLKVVVDN
jgi:hypothetical protein